MEWRKKYIEREETGMGACTSVCTGVCTNVCKSVRQSLFHNSGLQSRKVALTRTLIIGHGKGKIHEFYLENNSV